MESPVINHELPVKQEDDEDEDAAWAKFNPMKDEFENVTENSYMKDSVGGTLPRKLYYGRKNPGEPKEVKLYVSKIPKHITESGLRNIFAKHGNVLYVHLVSKKDQSYRYGFVSLSNIIEADRAIQGLNHKPPFNLHIEFEMSEQDKNERVLVENCIPALLKMDFNHTEDPLYEHDADYTIKEKVLFSPGLPLEGLDWNQFPSCADALEEYHLYDLLPQCTQLYEPYLVWDASNVDDVRHALALRSYIAVDHWIGKNVMSQESTLPRLHQITNSNSVKTFGVQESRPIQSCVYCHRRVFKTSPLLCSCGVVYDDIMCQHQHWPVHKTQCMDQKSSGDCIDSTTDTRDVNSQEEDDFTKVIQEFKTFYSCYGTVVDHSLGAINIVPKLWWNENSAVSFITNESLIKSYLPRHEEIEKQPDLSPDQVHIGQLVGVLLVNPPLYVRGIVACTTGHGLIGVLPLEIDPFVLVTTVKLLNHTTGGASHVQCTIEHKDENYSLESSCRRQFTRVKNSSSKYRAFDESLNSCTVQLTPYLPCVEQLPLCCISIENKTKVILTAFHSSKVFYVQPLDMNIKIKFTTMASDFNLWCTNNHPNQTSDWIPKKNNVVGVRLTSGEYQRGQVIGTVTPWRADVVDNSKPNVQTEKLSRYYLVSLIDSGNNLKVGIENLVQLAPHLRKDLINEESMTADLILESGESVSDHIDNLTALPWQIIEGESVKDPTKTDQVCTLSQLTVPLYPLQRNHRYPLRLMKIIDTCYASMMVLSREEVQYVHTELGDCMKQYCDQLTLDKYNPASGTYCLAYCRELKLWTRARCEKCSEQHGHCYVFLVDYGVHAHLPITDLRPCHFLFTQYHSLAFIAYIPELETIELSESEILRKYATHSYRVMDVVKCNAQNTQDRVVLAL
uniref:RRM domain-containing protein n=3 Tax=Cacopsylla melanoneura TaxID=428564 RepID=A0A8D8YBU2_9HEMI